MERAGGRTLIKLSNKVSLMRNLVVNILTFYHFNACSVVLFQKIPELFT